MREVPSIPAGLDPKLRNVLSAVRESLNAAITNINLYAENLAGLRQWIQPALDNNTDLITFNESFIQASLESATGADGAAGIAARAVSLTTPSQSFTYDTNGANPSPATSVITATVFNTVGVVYYEFFLNDVSTGTATTSNTYTYTPRSAFTGMPDKLEVQIREDGLDGAIEARDQMTMIGLKAGSHGITVMLSNEAHTLPRSTAGVVTYTGSGTKINVWEGTTALTEDSSSPYANSTFRVTTAATGITPGSITGTGTTTLTYGDANSMTTSPAKIDFTIIAKRQDGTEITISKQQSLSYSQAGATGAGGDAVDLVFVRAASQPATPTASSGTPTAPITWYTDVASVPASPNPLWSSAGFKASASANYTWDTPVRVEGASVAEVTVFTRGVPTSTPTGGTYTFSNPPVLVVPTSTGATWYTSIPSGTTAVYTSRAVVSTAAGNTSAVAITGWTTPVISFQNGNDGSNGGNGSRGTFTTYAAIGYPGWDSATAYAAIIAMPNSQSTLVVGDEVTLCYPNTTTPSWVLTQYVASIGNPGTWSVRGQVFDGNLMITGSLSAASLKTSNLTAANAISVVNTSNATRVKMGNLGSSYGLQGWNNANASVFKLDENGLDSKITQNALNLFGSSYHNRIILEGAYVFTILGSAVQTVVLPITVSTSGMYRLKAQVTGYWENDNYNTSHALWREMSMGVYYRNSTSTSISMGVVSESSDTTDATNYPASKVTLQVNATTEQPELKLVSRAGTAGINNYTYYSYIIWAIDNVAYPYDIY